MPETGYRAPDEFTPGHPARLAEQSFNDPLRLRSIKETALLCKRKEATIRNLVSLYALPKKRAFIVRHRRRQCAIHLREDVVLWLMQITLLGDKAARLRPPR